MDFITVPNQRVVTIHKPPHKKGDFTTVGVSAMLAAMENLSYSEFMLYCYLMLNADGFRHMLSPTYIYRNTALTKNTYQRAFHELEKKGYLVQNPTAKTYFDFYEIPKSGTPCTQKHDAPYPKEVENINKQNENNNAQAPSLDATGAAPISKQEIEYFDF